MNLMIKILSLIAESMLLPVILLVITMFLYSLILLGDFFSLYLRLLRNHRNLKAIMGKINETGLAELENIGKCHFALKLQELANLNWHPIVCNKKIADFHQSCSRDLEKSKFLIRIGPMLGLMGTLIPLGPALVALANGNMASMAINMQVAFATTVVGIFIGAVGFITHLVKSRWYNEEISNLQYVLDLNIHADERKNK